MEETVPVPVFRDQLLFPRVGTKLLCVRGLLSARLTLTQFGPTLSALIFLPMEQLDFEVHGD